MKYFLWTLTILFVGLKLTNYIDGSWLFVLLPAIIYILFLVFCFVVMVIAGVANEMRGKNGYK
jgi:hypothetical protein